MIELVVVVALIGILTAFGLPSYLKSIRKAHEKDIILQLTTLYAADYLYKGQSGSFLKANITNINTLNSLLNISLITVDGTTFDYASFGSWFNFEGQWGGDDGFTVRITDAPMSDTNPCCVDGECPTLASC